MQERCQRPLQPGSRQGASGTLATWRLWLQENPKVPGAKGVPAQRISYFYVAASYGSPSQPPNPFPSKRRRHLGQIQNRRRRHLPQTQRCQVPGRRRHLPQTQTCQVPRVQGKLRLQTTSGCCSRSHKSTNDSSNPLEQPCKSPLGLLHAARRGSTKMSQNVWESQKTARNRATPHSQGPRGLGSVKVRAPGTGVKTL